MALLHTRLLLGAPQARPVCPAPRTITPSQASTSGRSVCQAPQLLLGSSGLRSALCMRQPALRATSTTQAGAVTEEPEAIPAPKGRLALDISPEVVEPGTPDLPKPSEFQQTLWKSFTIGGVGLHTGEYAVVRVRPAYAGEGRYFVRVPEGTNKARFEPYEGIEIDTDELDEPGPNNEELESLKVRLYREYLAAQVDEDYMPEGQGAFTGTFTEFLDHLESVPYVNLIKAGLKPTWDWGEPEEIQARSETEEYILATVDSIYSGFGEDEEDQEDEAALVEALGRDLTDQERDEITNSMVQDVHLVLVNGDFKVHSVELLLSALEACGVDNARIEIEGGSEIPVFDGSAEGWANEIGYSGLRLAMLPPGVNLDDPDAEETSSETTEATSPSSDGTKGETKEAGVDGSDDDEEEEEGLSEDDELKLDELEKAVKKAILRPEGPIVVMGDDGAFISFVPEDNIRLSVGLDHSLEAPVIGKLWLTWCPLEDLHYKFALADSRYYAPNPESVLALREQGYLKAGAEGVMIIGFGDRWYDPQMIRHEDEPVRNAAAQLIGALSLLGANGNSGLPAGHIVAYNATGWNGFRLAIKFVRALQETISEDTMALYQDITGARLPDMLSNHPGVIENADWDDQYEMSPEDNEDLMDSIAAMRRGGDDDDDDVYDEGADEGDDEDLLEEAEMAAAGFELPGDFDDEEEVVEGDGDGSDFIDVDAIDVTPGGGSGKGKGGRGSRKRI